MILSYNLKNEEKEFEKPKECEISELSSIKNGKMFQIIFRQLRIFNEF